MLQRAADERFGEQPHLGLFGRGRRQFGDFAPFGGAFFVLDGGGALGIPERRQFQFQIVRRVQVMLKQKLHGAFARFSSFAHEPILTAKVQSLKSKVKQCARLWTADFGHWTLT